MQCIYKKIKMEEKKNLELIEEMIQAAKGNISEGSIFYLIWGWLVLVAAAVNYILLMYTEYPHHWVAWPILMTLGGVVSIIVGYRKDKKKTVTTYPERAMKNLWFAFLITLLAVLFGMGRIGVEFSYPIIMLLYGLGTFVSGGILKFNPLRVGGVIAWICGVLAFYQSFPEQLLLIMVAIIASYIVPGHLLAKSNKRYV